MFCKLARMSALRDQVCPDRGLCPLIVVNQVVEKGAVNRLARPEVLRGP